jgi:hypothetical protein
MENDINTLKLIATAAAHLQVHGIAGARIGMPGTDKLIVIGDQKWINQCAAPEAPASEPAAPHAQAEQVYQVDAGNGWRDVQKFDYDLYVEHSDGSIKTRTLYAAPVPQEAEQAAPAAVTDADIRKVFLKNGFTIKEGQADLKPYVYVAAYELLSLAYFLAPAVTEAEQASVLAARAAALEEAAKLMDEPDEPDSLGALNAAAIRALINPATTKG